MKRLAVTCDVAESEHAKVCEILCLHTGRRPKREKFIVNAGSYETQQTALKLKAFEMKAFESFLYKILFYI